MKIAIAGSSGLVGSALQKFFSKKNDQVIKLVRSNPTPDTIFWDPHNHIIDHKNLEGIDVLINVAGENIASGRWTKEKKKRIRESRIDTTRTLCNAIKTLSQPPKLFINASAVGYYENYQDHLQEESSPPGHSFLSNVCTSWEKELETLEETTTRIVILRFGIILSPKGGMLKKILTPFKWGLGGILGSGNQYLSWIAIDDLLSIFDYVIKHKNLSGPINACSPYAVTNKIFTKELSTVLKRPAFFTLPEFLLRWIFGEMANELLLSSTRAFPKKLLDDGFCFKYPHLHQALTHLC